MDIESALKGNNTVLQTMSKFDYQSSLFSLMRGLKGKKVCYISLNKPASSVSEGLNKKKISTANTFFIDAVSSSLGEPEEKDNVLLVSSPAALTELSIAIMNALKGSYFDAFVFDSLSTLNIYNLGAASERFVKKVINSINSKKGKGIFVCLDEDVNTQLVKNSILSIDTILQPTAGPKVKNLAAVASFLGLIVGVPLLTSVGEGFSSGPVGYAVAETAGPGVNLFMLSQVASYGLVLGASALLIYRENYLASLPETTLRTMRGSHSKRKFSPGIVMGKIKHWARKRRN